MRSTVRSIVGLGTLVLAGVMFINIAGCGSAYVPPPYAPPPAPNKVDMDAAHWNILYGANMPSHPTALQTGWQFNIPADPGSVHYIEVPFNATGDLTGKTFTITYRVVSNGPVYNANVETGESGPPSFHLFIQRFDDNFTNQYYRWWCGSGGYTLGTKDNQTLTLSCPLTYSAWSSVYGAVDKTQFADTLSNLGWVGMTFGGTGGWGHGVNLLGGSAQFQLLDASINTPVPAI